MSEFPVQQLSDRVAAEIESRLGVGGRDLAQKLRRAGRLLPGHVRKDIRRILDAKSMADNPRLARQIDMPRIEAAERRVLAYLKTIDRADRRKGAVLGLLGGLSFNLIAAFALLIAVLVWRGLV
ncbi:hypothetical protein [Actibacterium ureilyticum]|uniref:hypothetical protein n=1 Tax=Actibacterium ureilyticum TaxID=1590614 RepID=UPI000BAAD9DF|nr:hypothetical protein [Actibacterium ureilyticum]